MTVTGLLNDNRSIGRGEGGRNQTNLALGKAVALSFANSCKCTLKFKAVFVNNSNDEQDDVQ